jgi:hypothetical protein
LCPIVAGGDVPAVTRVGLSCAGGQEAEPEPEPEEDGFDSVAVGLESEVDFDSEAGFDSEAEESEPDLAALESELEPPEGLEA